MAGENWLAAENKRRFPLGARLVECKRGGEFAIQTIARVTGTQFILDNGHRYAYRTLTLVGHADDWYAMYSIAVEHRTTSKTADVILAERLAAARTARERMAARERLVELKREVVKALQNCEDVELLERMAALVRGTAAAVVLRQAGE